MLLAFLLQITLSVSQSVPMDTLYVMKGGAIQSNRLTHFSAGSKIVAFDSIGLAQHKHQSLADLLADESPLFIKSYGLGSLATSSFRGGSASQTTVLWNGFNINSPMNGQIDFSLIPVNFSDAVSIQYGGSGPSWGSGAVAGSIHLNNIANFNKGITLKINLGNGSFGSYSKQASVEISKKKMISSVKLFHTSAKNNFQYNNIYSGENKKTTQTNAELKNYGLLSENNFIISKTQKINFMCWLQHTDRELPPTMLQNSSASKQMDESFRLSSEYRLDHKKISTFLRSAMLNEKLIYEDVNGISKNRSRTFITESETRITLSKKHAFNFGLSNNFSMAMAEAFLKNPQQNRLSFFTAYAYTSKNSKIKFNTSLRKEFMAGKTIPFVYSVGSEYAITKHLQLKAMATRVYRLPTLNDWYWTPGGNPNLQSENGYAEEVGFKYNHITKSKSVHFSNECTFFNRQINNWIIWLPGNTYWSPENIIKVWSRGMETNSNMQVKIKQILLSLTVVTNYVVSTNQALKSAEDASLHKQLIYVPMYSGFAKLNIGYKQFSFCYRHTYTGYRYTSSDNSEYLSPYQLSSIYASIKFKNKKWNTSAFLQVNNLWNTQYQIIANRAMPLRNYALGLSFEINQPNK